MYDLPVFNSILQYKKTLVCHIRLGSYGKSAVIDLPFGGQFCGECGANGLLVSILAYALIVLIILGVVVLLIAVGLGLLKWIGWNVPKTVN
ncbi:hypothetical protein P9J70_11700 [Glaesserella parasuis]|uniref:hypothetical protein n=1 Tax=Glaesserella parasuis TaxID=738 RepID=UPI002436A206|nr:hypothetical protein [Glaesserella parasuis]MDG6232126.1 hypothetical protein [Glaesserella parasuis]